MKKRNFRRLLASMALAGILSVCCQGTEQTASTMNVVQAAEQTVKDSSQTDPVTPTVSSTVWKKKGSKRYCYRNGKKLTGFQQVDNSWYFFNSKGVMCTGWQYAGKHYRYFSPKTGKMRVNTSIQGRKIDSKGIWTPVVVLDPGHSGVVAAGYEPLGPGSIQMKAKDTSGTQGVATGVAEYKLTLTIAKQLSQTLKKQGCKVVMTRTNSKRPLSCVQRAKIANKAKADVYLRIHANGSTYSEANGAMTICVTPDNPYVSSKMYKKSYALSRKILDSYVEATGCKKEFIWQTDSMTGNNWSQVPTTLIEMGYMSNPSEDRKMQTKSYQKKMVNGMAEGIRAYLLG